MDRSIKLQLSIVLGTRAWDVSQAIWQYVLGAMKNNQEQLVSTEQLTKLVGQSEWSLWEGNSTISNFDQNSKCWEHQRLLHMCWVQITPVVCDTWKIGKL